MGINRAQLYEALGVEAPSPIESMLVAAYEREAQRDWRRENGYKQTSFFTSNFPGDDPLACGRAALYGLMGIPQDSPFDLTGQRWVEAGKALEMDFVRKLAAEGMLLSGDESVGEAQTKITDPEVWASGAVDAIVLPPFWRKSHVVEVKNTGRDKITAMRNNREDTPFSHEKYLRQVKTYVAYAHEQEYAPTVTICEETWAITKDALMGLHWCPVHHSLDCTTRTITLDPPDSGELIYASRDPEKGNDLDVVVYHVGYEPEFLAAGKRRLAEWRALFEWGVLPPHVHEGARSMWSVSPCKWCPMKKYACKPDHAAKVQTLEQSKAFKFAQETIPGYDYQAQRAAVFARWDVADPLAEKESAT